MRQLREELEDEKLKAIENAVNEERRRIECERDEEKKVVVREREEESQRVECKKEKERQRVEGEKVEERKRVECEKEQERQRVEGEKEEMARLLEDTARERDEARSLLRNARKSLERQVIITFCHDNVTPIQFYFLHYCQYI